MASDQEGAFHWFENLCDEFSRSPDAATAEIARFRETEEAYTLSQIVIQNSTKSHVQFHALSVLQHSYLTHYKKFTSWQNTELRVFLWSVISEKIEQFDASVATKLIHVFAIVLKRNWMTETGEDRSGVFSMISGYVSDGIGGGEGEPGRMKVAAKVISTMLEVFAKKKRTPDESIGYSPELQVTIHQCFQEDGEFCGLIACYQLSLQFLSKAFDLASTKLYTTAESGGVCFDYKIASTVRTVYVLMTDLLGWDFDTPTSASSGNNGESDEAFECGAVHLPASWVSLAGGATAFNGILAQLLECYELIRIALFGKAVVSTPISDDDVTIRSFLFRQGCSFVGNGASAGTGAMQSIRIAGEYMSSIRQLLLTFASFSSSSSAANYSSSNGLFASDSDKVGFSNHVLLQMITVLGYGVTALVSGRSGHYNTIGSQVLPEMVEDLLLNEVEHSIYILIRLFGNFHLTVIGQTTTFESFMVELGRVTFELSSNMATITDHRVRRAQGDVTALASAGEDDDFDSENVLDGWRGDILSQLMDLWSMVLDDAVMHRPRLVDMTPEYTMDVAIADNLRRGLFDMAGQVFARLFDCILLIALHDVLSSEEEDLDEDLEDIALRNMDEFLKGISLIGRSLALWTCVAHVRTHLQQSLTELSGLQQQAMSVLGQGAQSAGAGFIDIKNCTRQMEIQRICCLFLTHLLFEGGERSTSGGAVDASVLLDVSMATSSSDLTLVPKYIIEPLDCYLLQVTSNGGTGTNQGVDEFKGAVRQFWQEMNILLPMCTESVALQQQALIVTKQLREQLKARQIDGASYDFLRGQLDVFQSPLVMQHWFDFFTDYTRTYLGADSRMYRSLDLPMIIRLVSGCMEPDHSRNNISHTISLLVTSCIDPTDSSRSLKERINTVGQCVVTTLTEMGNENSMILVGLNFVKGLAVSLPTYELLQALSLDFVQQMFHIMTGGGGDGIYSSIVSRLTPDTLSKLWEATGLFASRLGVCASGVAATHVQGCNDFDNLMLQLLSLSVDDIIAIFGQVCDHLCAELANITDSSRNDPSVLTVAIAFLRGAARWVLTVSEDDWMDSDLAQIDTYQGNVTGIDLNRQHMVNQLITERRERIKSTSSAQHRKLYSGVFNTALPFVMSKICSLSTHESDVQLQLLHEVFGLIVDYTECQFVNLPTCEVVTLYEFTLTSMVTFANRQMAVQPTGREPTEDEAAAMITFLKVLDNLSAQEFVVPVDDVDGQTPTGVEETASRNQSPLVGLLRDANICEVVCVGVSVLSTILTPTVLLHYPKLQLNYFSMLAYVLSSSPEFILPSGGDASPQHQLHQIAGAMGMNKTDVDQSFNSILQLLLWGTVSSFDPAVIRMALQGIQHCAVAHLKSNGGRGCVIMNEFLSHCQEVFVEFLVGSCGGVASSSNGGTGTIGATSSLEWNRIDSFSYTFLVIIAYNPSRLMSDVLPRYVALQRPEVQEPLYNLFVSLTTANNVNISDIRKPNARIFSGNLRLFFDESRHLLLHHHHT